MPIVTLFKMLYGCKPDLWKVQTWSDDCYVHRSGRSKLDVCVRHAKWVGIEDELYVYRVYWPDTKTVTVECSVYFLSSNISNKMPLEELDKDILNAPKPC